MDNFNIKKYLFENNLGPFTKPEGVSADQVVDVDATLRSIQSAVRSGAVVMVGDKKIFKMPFINLATFEGGGKVQFPREAEPLEDMLATEITIDGKTISPIYKDAPPPPPKQVVTPFHPSMYSDSDSIYYRGGD
jgi:hypothetical protein